MLCTCQEGDLNSACDSYLNFFVAADEIAAIARSLNGQCLGWFVHQQAPCRLASARERAVTAALAGCVPPGMPVIFCLMATSMEPDLSTYSFHQQFHEQVKDSLANEEGISAAQETVDKHCPALR